MTIDQLIAEVLTNLHNHFYADKVSREFNRDRNALIKAIARYGYECDRRNWQFDAPFIFRDITALLLKIRIADRAPEIGTAPATGAQSRAPRDDSQTHIKFLPAYLEGAIDRHIRQRAEELSAHAKTIAPKIAKLTAGVRTVEAIREPTDVEILGTLFNNLKQTRKRRATTTGRPVTKQKELL